MLVWFCSFCRRANIFSWSRHRCQECGKNTWVPPWKRVAQLGLLAEIERRRA